MGSQVERLVQVDMLGARESNGLFVAVSGPGEQADPPGQHTLVVAEGWRGPREPVHPGFVGNEIG